MEKKAFIEAGRIVNTHGVRGEVKIEVWLDSPQFFKSFRRLTLPDGTEVGKSGWGIVDEQGNHPGYFYISYYDKSLCMGQQVAECAGG